MANMIEQSLLCKVLDAPDLEILHSNGVIEEMFLTCKEEIHFIIEHYNSYKQMPDKLTFLGRFKDFQMLEVTESTDYDKENDRNKLMYLTDQKEDFKYNFGLFVELGSHEVYVEVYQEGNLQTKLNYSITY